MAGLTEVDPTATMALLWDKVPQDKRLDAAGKRILERILTGAFRPAQQTLESPALGHPNLSVL